MEPPVEKDFANFRAWKKARNKWDYAQRKAADASPPPPLASPPTAATHPANARGAPRQRPSLEPTIAPPSPGGRTRCKLISSPGGTVYRREWDSVSYTLWPERAYDLDLWRSSSSEWPPPHSRENAMDRNRHAEAGALKHLRGGTSALASEEQPAERANRKHKSACSTALRSLLADSEWTLNRTDTSRMVEMAVDGLRAFLDSNGAFLDSDGEEQVTRADDGARWNNIQRFSATTATPRMVVIGARFLLRVEERGGKPTPKLVELLGEQIRTLGCCRPSRNGIPDLRVEDPVSFLFNDDWISDPRGFSEWRMHVDLNGQRWMPDREPLYRFGPDREPL